MSMFAASSPASAIFVVPEATDLRGDRVLIVGGENESCRGLREYIEGKGYEVTTAGTGAFAEQAWRVIRPDVALLDCNLPDGSLLGLIPRLKAIDTSTPIIILTEYGSIDVAVEALKLGAEQFLPKPAELSALHVLIERSLENRRNYRQQLAEKTVSPRRTPDPFLGRSDSIRKLADLAHSAALSDAPVLIQGEAGSGKETIARWLHRNSPRAREPFVGMNCGGWSRNLVETELFGDNQGDAAGTSRNRAGLLEIAHKGTVFLEGIENVDFRIQPKLLKVVEEQQFRRRGEVCDRRVDTRLIAATQQAIAQPAQHKQFRSDLYDRIGWISLSVPPLRERVEDIPILSARILGELAPNLGTGGLEPDGIALRALQGYSWPGNIRELRNVLERAALVAWSDVLADQDLHFEVQVEHYVACMGQPKTLAEVERSHIQQVLQRERGRVQAAARKLGMARSSLYNKLKRYKMDQSGMRPVF